MTIKEEKTKVVLLTGGSGMVGRNIRENANMQRWHVVAPGRDELNLLSEENCNEFVNDLKPDFVIHAAGMVGGIQANINSPVDFLVHNMDMGRNIVLAAKKARVRKFLNIGSSCMYPRNAVNPLMEEMVLNGELEPTNEGYALAKIITQRLCEFIVREDSFYQYKTIIPCNLYGRYDTFDPRKSHMLPSIIFKMHDALRSNKTEIEIWGDGEARREFMYAGDLAAFISFMLEDFDRAPGVMNVGLGEDFTVNEYYAAAAEVVGYSGRFVHDLNKPVGMRQKLVSVARQEGLGWSPSVNLIEGIQLTYDYYKQEYIA
ncbi:MAG: NAD-dependent epimerase/dehydratase family protein [Crocinitomicaceae bacterium]|nr:NAD-dependent epimerase/dehydratase family protein [Crocinitomicaceae bacterium]